MKKITDTKKDCLEFDCKGYFTRKRFEEWIQGTKLYIENDCYKLFLDRGFWKQYELADLYFFTDKILAKTEDSTFEFVKKIFQDFCDETQTHVVIEIKEEVEHYY